MRNENASVDDMYVSLSFSSFASFEFLSTPQQSREWIADNMNMGNATWRTRHELTIDIWNLKFLPFKNVEVKKKKKKKKK